MTARRNKIHNEMLDPLGDFWFELVVFFKRESNFLNTILLNIGGRKNVFLLSFYSMKGC